MINYNTCKMDDVIARSLAMHPSLLGEAIANAAKVHGQARDTMVSGETRRIAADMATLAWKMVLDIRTDDLFPCELDFSSRIIAFTAAARLNCLSHLVAADIAARG